MDSVSNNAQTIHNRISPNSASGSSPKGSAKPEPELVKKKAIETAISSFRSKLVQSQKNPDNYKLNKADIEEIFADINYYLEQNLESRLSYSQLDFEDHAAFVLGGRENSMTIPGEIVKTAKENYPSGSVYAGSPNSETHESEHTFKLDLSQKDAIRLMGKEIKKQIEQGKQADTFITLAQHRSDNDPRKMWDVNVKSTQNTLDVFSELGIADSPKLSIILTGTDATKPTSPAILNKLDSISNPAEKIPAPKGYEIGDQNLMYAVTKLAQEAILKKDSASFKRLEKLKDRIVEIEDSVKEDPKVKLAQEKVPFTLTALNVVSVGAFYNEKLYQADIRKEWTSIMKEASDISKQLAVKDVPGFSKASIGVSTTELHSKRQAGKTLGNLEAWITSLVPDEKNWVSPKEAGKQHLASVSKNTAKRNNEGQDNYMRQQLLRLS